MSDTPDLDAAREALAAADRYTAGRPPGAMSGVVERHHLRAALAAHDALAARVHEAEGERDEARGDMGSLTTYIERGGETPRGDDMRTPAGRALLAAYAAEDDDRYACAQHNDRLIRGLERERNTLAARLAEREAEVAEMQATLANERGEGEPPSEGWEWDARDGSWESPHPVRGYVVVGLRPDGWAWDADIVRSPPVVYPSARAAMIAADVALRTPEAP